MIAPTDFKLRATPFNVSTFAGLTISIPCSVLKNDSFVVWRKQDKPVYQDRAVSVAADGTLVIRRSEVRHSGQYECWAVGERGVTVATIQIRVETRAGDLV